MSGHGGDQDESDVGAELRRLLRSDELGPRSVPEHAVTAVVAGARRRRRRRAAVGAGAGAFVMVGAVTAAVALSGVAGPEGTDREVIAADRSDVSTAAPPGDDPATQPSPGPDLPQDTEPGTPSSPGEPEGPLSTETQAPSVPPSPGLPVDPRGSSSPESPLETKPFNAPAGPVLSANGRPPLSLGMGYNAAVETGAMDEGAGPPAQGQCKSYAVSDRSISRVAIRGGQGIVRFQAETAQTPEGIGVGSSVDELEAAYPDLENSGENQRVKRNPDASSRYTFGIAGGSVSTMRLTVPSPAATC